MKDNLHYKRFELDFLETLKLFSGYDNFTCLIGLSCSESSLFLKQKILTTWNFLIQVTGQCEEKTFSLPVDLLRVHVAEMEDCTAMAAQVKDTLHLLKTEIFNFRSVCIHSI